jgi:uncharacterized membrane protein (DUF4010 family)
MSDPLELFASLALALAAGLLIGLERERSAREEDRRADSFLGGVRTHPLIALVGGVATLAARQLGVAAVALAFLALLVLVALSYAGDVLRGGHRGITSEAAFLLSFLLGVLALTQGVIEPLATRSFVVAGTAVAATFLLSSKATLHPLVHRITREDVAATLKFLVVAVVVLPLLPDRTFGPYDVLNPHALGILLVLISGISFVGFAAIRLLGAERGLGLTGLVGGLVSSTAVTLAMAGQAREHEELADAGALAVMLASTVMFVRVVVVVAIIDLALVRPLAYPMGLGALGGALSCVVLWRRARHASRPGSQVEFKNPFELTRAVAFALLFGLVLLGSKAASVHLGAGGTYAAGILGGAADVDTVVLSMASLARGGGVPGAVAATAIFLGVAANTLTKGFLAASTGGVAFGRRVLPAQLLVLATGAAGAALTWLA